MHYIDTHIYLSVYLFITICFGEILIKAATNAGFYK